MCARMCEYVVGTQRASMSVRSLMCVCVLNATRTTAPRTRPDDLTVRYECQSSTQVHKSPARTAAWMPETRTHDLLSSSRAPELSSPSSMLVLIMCRSNGSMLDAKNAKTFEEPCRAFRCAAAVASTVRRVVVVVSHSEHILTLFNIILSTSPSTRIRRRVCALPSLWVFARARTCVQKLNA